MLSSSHIFKCRAALTGEETLNVLSIVDAPCERAIQASVVDSDLFWSSEGLNRNIMQGKILQEEPSSCQCTESTGSKVVLGDGREFRIVDHNSVADSGASGAGHSL